MYRRSGFGPCFGKQWVISPSFPQLCSAFLGQLDALRNAENGPYLFGLALRGQAIENDRAVLVAVLGALAKGQPPLCPSSTQLGKAAITSVAANHELETSRNRVNVAVGAQYRPVTAIVSAQSIRASAAGLGKSEKRRTLR
jgi:hypothetical protein